MNNKIILASKSEVRKNILYENRINCEVIPSHVDEEEIKKSLLNEGATPLIVSKNLAELKANKISKKVPEKISPTIQSAHVGWIVSTIAWISALSAEAIRIDSGLTPKVLIFFSVFYV